MCMQSLKDINLCCSFVTTKLLFASVKRHLVYRRPKIPHIKYICRKQSLCTCVTVVHIRIKGRQTEIQELKWTCSQLAGNIQVLFLIIKMLYFSIQCA